MKRARQSAPAELSQECVKEALEAFMKKSGSSDLAKLLQPLKSTATWKNAPSQCIPALCGLEDLFVEILKRCPSGVLPPKKTGLAVMSCNKASLCNHTPLDEHAFADKMSTQIRIGLSKLRDIAESATVRDRTFRKADADQMASIKRMINYIGEFPSPNSSHAIVPYSADSSDHDWPTAFAQALSEFHSDDEIRIDASSVKAKDEGPFLETRAVDRKGSWDDSVVLQLAMGVAPLLKSTKMNVRKRPATRSAKAVPKAVAKTKTKKKSPGPRVAEKDDAKRLLKNAASKAYHAAKKAALARGESQEAAGESARAAHREVIEAAQ
jgi:hypothetical protein